MIHRMIPYLLGSVSSFSIVWTLTTMSEHYAIVRKVYVFPDLPSASNS